MRRIGICTCCGKERIVQDHHSKGYLSPYENFTEPYCVSCDHLEHIEAKKIGLRKFSREEVNKLYGKKSNRVKILLTLKEESAEKLRSLAFYLNKTESEILDELLEGYR